MTVRLFVVAAALLVGLVFNLVLAFVEVVPSPNPEQQMGEVTVIRDPLGGLPYTASSRRGNLGRMGLPDPMVEQVMKRIEELAASDEQASDAKKWLSLIKADQAGAPLCKGRELPPRYAAAQFLVAAIEGVADRDVVDATKVRAKGLQLQPGANPEVLLELHRTYELQPSPIPGATAIVLLAYFVGQETDALEKAGDFQSGIMGSLNLNTLLNRYPQSETKLVEYFALMHLLVETAQAPTNEFCTG